MWSDRLSDLCEISLRRQASPPAGSRIEPFPPQDGTPGEILILQGHSAQVSLKQCLCYPGEVPPKRSPVAMNWVLFFVATRLTARVGEWSCGISLAQLTGWPLACWTDTSCAWWEEGGSVYLFQLLRSRDQMNPVCII